MIRSYFVQYGAWVAAALSAWALGPVRGVVAEEFRVDNQVFIDDHREPRTRSTTIFSGGLVYDFLERPAEITIFDPAQKRFVLLDPARRVKTELTADEVWAVCLDLKKWAGTQTDPLLRFMAEPEFEEQFDEQTGELVFASPWLTYRVRCVPADDESMARQYRQFSDWFVRLNSRLSPGSKLPFARLRINEVLERRRELPREVKLTIQTRRGLSVQRHVARSQHVLASSLNQADRDRIAQATQFLAIFQPVDFDQYDRKMRR